MMRVILIMVIWTLLLGAAPSRAASIPCDKTLFDASAQVGRSGAMMEPGHWRFTDLPYTVDYYRHNGKQLGVSIIVRRNNKVLASATRYNDGAPIWGQCHAGNGWKVYILNK